jgi:F-type H+-transporting ATPase subunit b
MLATLYSAVFVAAGAGGEWLPKTVNLAIFLAFLYFLLRKPMAAFFASRSKAIVADLERAKRERDEAEAKLAEVDARLSKLAAERDQIRAEAEREAEAELARLSARTEEDARKIAETAEREIDGALKAARADLQRFAAEKAVELAEAQIRGEMSDEDRKRLIGDYADQLDEVKK